MKADTLNSQETSRQITKKTVDETVEYARQGMEGFKQEEQSVIQEMRDECNRQELQAAELNFQLQERVDELVEKLTKYSGPKLRIEEIDQGPGDVQLEMFATPKSASAKAGATPMPNMAMTDLAADAREKLHSLFSTTPAGSAAGMPAEPKFPGKVKPPPPALMKWPGYASSQMLPPPPKGEAPKPPVPAVPKAVAKPAEPSAEEQPAKKKAALTSEPKPMAVASSAAVFLEPAPKAPPAKAAKAGSVTPPPGLPSSKSAAKSKSLVTKSRLKSDEQAQKPETVKIEASECRRCCAKTIKGQLECDVCGRKVSQRLSVLQLQSAAKQPCTNLESSTISKASTSRRSPEISLKPWGDQARGSTSPEADLIRRAKGRSERAIGMGYDSVLDRFTKDATFAESLLAEGRKWV